MDLILRKPTLQVFFPNEEDRRFGVLTVKTYVTEIVCFFHHQNNQNFIRMRFNWARSRSFRPILIMTANYNPEFDCFDG